MKSVGLFGGTFNPVHIGHLRTAVALREILALDEMRLVPCALPAHRALPEVTAEHRLSMLQAAIADTEGLVVDDCELRRQARCPDIPSYTIDTLIEFRARLGEQTKICLCIGMDSLVNLASWYRWQDILDYAHIVVAARPGWQQPLDCDIAQLLALQQVNTPQQLSAPCGHIWLAQMPLWPVSSTQVRDALVAGRPVRHLLPDGAIDYIRQHQLYIAKQ